MGQAGKSWTLGCESLSSMVFQEGEDGDGKCRHVTEMEGGTIAMVQGICETSEIGE